MRVSGTHQLAPDPLVLRLLGDIAEAAEHMRHGRYDEALATLETWAADGPPEMPNFADRLPPRLAWNDLVATIPAPLMRPLYAAPLQHLAELIAHARHVVDVDLERVDLIREWAADFGVRLVRNDASDASPAA